MYWGTIGREAVVLAYSREGIPKSLFMPTVVVILGDLMNILTVLNLVVMGWFDPGRR